jgi:hypothetical protein
MAQKLGSNWFQKVPNCTKKGVKTEDFTPKDKKVKDLMMKKC